MTPEEHDARQNALFARFPRQFVGETIGRSIQPGWLELVEAACADVDAWLDAEPARALSWFQIKEKFGTLRMYPRAQRADAALSAIIDWAERRSLLTCQLCGAPGEHRIVGGLMTLCAAHATYPGRRDAEPDFDLWTTRFDVVGKWFGADLDMTLGPSLLPILADLRVRHGHAVAISLLSRSVDRFGGRTALDVLVDGTVAPAKILKILTRLA
jgi:hypothetical protein